MGSERWPSRLQLDRHLPLLTFKSVWRKTRSCRFLRSRPLILSPLQILHVGLYALSVTDLSVIAPFADCQLISVATLWQVWEVHAMDRKLTVLLQLMDTVTHWPQLVWWRVSHNTCVGNSLHNSKCLYLGIACFGWHHGNWGKDFTFLEKNVCNRYRTWRIILKSKLWWFISVQLRFQHTSNVSLKCCKGWSAGLYCGEDGKNSGKTWDLWFGVELFG